jgi:hypothetical protein
MNKKIKLAYLMILGGKKPYHQTVKDLKSGDIDEVFRFLSNMDVGKFMPWFAEKP